MARKKVEFHEEASLEYEAAFEWYFERSSSVASRFATEVDRAVGVIVEAPQRCPASTNGTRKFLLQTFPFGIIYRDSPSIVQVLAIAHGHRRPGYWKERL
jgi:plasmid stabilization system protein ParE